jgi:hypothetical protein
MLSSQDKIDVAISCMHHKAFDYVVANFFLETSKKHCLFPFERKNRKELNWYMARM